MKRVSLVLTLAAAAALWLAEHWDTVASYSPWARVEAVRRALFDSAAKSTSKMGRIETLEKIDTRLVEAAKDLYAGPWRPAGTFAGAIVGASLAGVLAAAFEYDVLTWAAVGLVTGALIGTLFLSESFIRVVLPLSLPGVFAGSLLVFIPAMGDYINAELLGNQSTRMIGNVIQNRLLVQNDYPVGSALSFMLMAGILVAVTVYARALGTEQLTG